MKLAPALVIDVVPPGLVHVTDDAPGITRRRQGTGFSYRRPNGSVLRDAAELQRIRRLAIPPAYTQVWICTNARGYLQATGRDARGRKQYRYHADWRVARDADKYDRLLDFAAALPRIRARVRRDLAARRGLARDTVLATIVRLLDTTLLRIGNEEYARSNQSFGLSTLRRRHVSIRGDTLRLHFRGKSGIERKVAVDDPAVARVVRRCQSLPGQDLFRYVDDAGRVQSVGSADVNDYLRDASQGNFSAKDFRTWHGSVHAMALATQAGTANDSTLSAESATARAARVKQLLAQVASRLGNTVAVCRKAYVHPQVLALLGGDVAVNMPIADDAKPRRGLLAEERQLVAFLATRPKPGHRRRR